MEKPYIVSMCIVEIHEIKQTESKQTKTYNLGKNLLRHIIKILIFCTYPDKNAYSRKLKDLPPPPLPYGNVVYGNRRNAYLGC